MQPIKLGLEFVVLQIQEVGHRALVEARPVPR